ncbi:MAG: VanZ family protein [Anaerolineae bacterium]|jgi:VanZ family protein
MRRAGRFFSRWLPPLVWMGVIFLLSAQPDLPHAPGPWLDTLVKKAGHAVAYGVLAWFLLRALVGGGVPSDRLRLLSLALALVYAGSDEIHQAFVPGRHPAVTDVLIDGVGAATALALHRQWARGRGRS